MNDWRPRPKARCCDHSGCPEVGEFRAPRSRDRLDKTDDYFWFCLGHVREYNSAWNYYAGMSEPEIEQNLRHDTVWQRPTWPLGWRVAGHKWRDPLNIYAEHVAENKARAEAKKRPITEEERACAVFELEVPFTLTELKSRYKILVKMHHPDANGGSKEAEERLKIITHAYAVLKARYFA